MRQGLPGRPRPLRDVLVLPPKNFGKAQEYHLFDCIECGCCSFVCPSHIPLVDYFRFSKSEIWAREREKGRGRHRPRPLRIQEPPPGAREAGKSREARRQGRRHPREVVAEAPHRRQALPPAKPTGDDAKRALIEAAMEKPASKGPGRPKNTDVAAPDDQAEIAAIDARRRQQPAPDGLSPLPSGARLQPMINSPFVRKPASVQSVMLQVLLALLPGIAAYVWFFGPGILVQLALASAPPWPARPPCWPSAASPRRCSSPTCRPSSPPG
jgi:ferredoxin